MVAKWGDEKSWDSTDYIRAVVTPLKTLAGSKILSSLSNDCTVKGIPLESRLQCLWYNIKIQEMRLHVLKALSSEWHFCVQNIVRHSYGHCILWNKQIKQYLLCWQDSWKHLGRVQSLMDAVCVYLYLCVCSKGSWYGSVFFGFVFWSPGKSGRLQFMGSQSRIRLNDYKLSYHL